MKTRIGQQAFAALLTAGLLLTASAPSAIASPNVGVNVWVENRPSYDGKVWVRFSPERESYVALYALFSDGSVEPIFPIRNGSEHWVDSCHPQVVTVRVPCGVSLESVQAFASCDWFDPWDCWQACAPRHRGDRWRSPLQVAAAYSYPFSGWSFSLHWDSGWRSDHRDSGPRRLVAVSGGHPSSRKWKSSQGQGRGEYVRGHNGDDDDDDSWSNKSSRPSNHGSVGKKSSKRSGRDVVQVNERKSGDGKEKSHSGRKTSKGGRVSGEPKGRSRG